MGACFPSIGWVGGRAGTLLLHIVKAHLENPHIVNAAALAQLWGLHLQHKGFFRRIGGQIRIVFGEHPAVCACACSSNLVVL